ncbi:MAG: response regulator [Anaerolineales bacterium]|nr:response regulator [Anaerolineales bacterium]
MPKKVLIVDDEAHIRLLLEQTLEDLEDQGVELLMANDGEEALELIKSQQPELIYLDIMMPKLNGFDVCQIVKHQWNLRHIYIIMLTAKGQEFDKKRGLEVGADSYLTKPFDPDELLETTSQILGL